MTQLCVYSIIFDVLEGIIGYQKQLMKIFPSKMSFFHFWRKKLEETCFFQVENTMFFSAVFSIMEETCEPW